MATLLVTQKMPPALAARVERAVSGAALEEFRFPVLQSEAFATKERHE